VSEIEAARARVRAKPAWLSRPQVLTAHSEQRFECDSHGDRVGGRLWLPRGAGRERLLLALHPLGGSAGDSGVANIAAGCAAAGFAVAAIDLPLHGERHNAKLSRRAVAAASASESAPDASLWSGLVAQAARDLAQVLAALAAVVPARAAVAAFAGTLPIALAHARANSSIERVFAIAAQAPEAAEKSVVSLARPDDLPAALAQW
jgi:hypothetical protein